MILAVDVGNTHIVLGAMEGGRARVKARFATDVKKTEFEYALEIFGMLSFYSLSPEAFEGAALSSVVPPLTDTISKAIELACGLTPIVLGSGVKTGLNIKLDNPAEAGADLVAAAVGAMRKYTPPMIIIDMGTATTISAIDRNGAFVGGVIVPGVSASLDALTGAASLLPKISLEAPKAAIGRNTVDSMKSGAIFGAAALLDGMAERIDSELGGGSTTIATGGLSRVVVPHMKRDVTLNDDLILEGLVGVFERNKGGK